MLGWWGQKRWLTCVGLLALALLVLSFSPIAARAAFGGGGIPCVHVDEARSPAFSSGVMPLPCDGHHCVHGPFCCMSSCLAFADLALPAETPLLASFLDFAVYPLAPPTRPNGLGVRPARYSSVK